MRIKKNDQPNEKTWFFAFRRRGLGLVALVVFCVVHFVAIFSTRLSNGQDADQAPRSSTTPTFKTESSATASDDGNWRSADAPKTESKPSVSASLDALPADAGQFWVEYDLTPYSERFENVEYPQTAIVDWIALDAGENFWTNEPFAVFSASPKALRVYHNAGVQRYVANVVDRFVESKERRASFSIKVVALQSPDWRIRVASSLTPVSPKSFKIVGSEVDAQGWLVEPTDFSRVVSEIEKRSDYLLLNSSNNAVPNGEKYGWTIQAPKRRFVRDVRADPTAVGGYVEDFATVDEGFRVEATPLVSTNGDGLEVFFRYKATVVEKIKTFHLRVPTSTAPRQQFAVEKPEIASCDVKGRIGFLRSKRAIVDLGLVPLTPPNRSERSGVVGTITNFVAPKSAFYNVLIIIGEN